MNKRILLTISLALFISIFQFTINNLLWTCTSLIVTKKASTDGSVMITYLCDGEAHARINITKNEIYKDGKTFKLKYKDGKTAEIPMPEKTYSVVGLMNEHQLAIGETTFDGRKELHNPDGLFNYWQLMVLALKTSKTARDAIDVITKHADKYGYKATGESFSIGDKNEAWILELIGPGPGGKGAIWVAIKVPDGKICAHANKAVIGEFPLDDPENCIYSKNVIKFAVEKGYYDPKSGEPFKFNEAYCPSTPKNKRWGDMRVWSIYNRANSKLNLSSDWHRAKEGAKRYPLFIEPEKKLSVRDVFSLMRDHYEGTDFDMTKGIDAGPYGCPYRWRPLNWEIDGKEYVWERAVSTQQTCFSFVSQSRSWLEDEIGGVFWLGVDDTYTCCYIPLYCGINEMPKAYRTGNINRFTWDSAWWVFNLTTNIAYSKYSCMIKEIQKLQAELETSFIDNQEMIDKVASELYKKDKKKAIDFLTNYSVNQGNMVVEKWKELAILLITRYNDGYRQNDKHRAESNPYPDSWLKMVIKERPKQFLLPENKDKPESKLVD